MAISRIEIAMQRHGDTLVLTRYDRRVRRAKFILLLALLALLAVPLLEGSPNHQSDGTSWSDSDRRDR